MCKTCQQCGQELAAELSFCTFCGTKQDIQIYPITKKNRPQSVGAILSALSIGAISVNMLIQQISISQHQFYDYVTQEVVTPGFSLFFLIFFSRSDNYMYIFITKKPYKLEASILCCKLPLL